MKHVIEEFYCDGCGIGRNTAATNVPYLGWVFITAYPDGIPGVTPLKADLCSTCAKRVWASIPMKEDS